MTTGRDRQSKVMTISSDKPSVACVSELVVGLFTDTTIYSCGGHSRIRLYYICMSDNSVLSRVDHPCPPDQVLVLEQNTTSGDVPCGRLGGIIHVGHNPVPLQAMAYPLKISIL